MIRVGFLLAGPAGAWLGGANYMRSLFGAISSLPGRNIDPVIFVSKKHAGSWRGHFPAVPMIETALLDHWTLPWIARKLIQRVTSKDILLGRLFLHHNVSIFSHGWGLGKGAAVRCIGWIPDFQHVHLPGFFTPEICSQRDQQFLNICKEADAVIVSSEDVKKDLVAFCPDSSSKVKVLRFVPQLPDITLLPTRETLEARYNFKGAYFHVPNQFWKHKNHIVVIEALALLREKGIPIQILATGNTHDFRNPNYFCDLQALVRQKEIDNEFRVLGMVPFDDLLGLIHHSIAVINPSFFEGWSTSVEEAKCLGAKVLLSDLPVHREQAPPGGVYFDPRDPADLADKLVAALALAGTAQPKPPCYIEKYQAFASEYEKIVIELTRNE